MGNKKSVISFILIFTMVFSLFNFKSKASYAVGKASESVEDFEYYTKEDGTVRITKYIGETDKDIVIPEKIEGNPVNEIGDGGNSVFRDRKSIEANIIVESKDVTLNESSFNGLLIAGYSLSFTNTIAKIGDKVFEGLQAGELVLPEDMKDIPVGKEIFKDASITHFAVPRNFKTADNRKLVDWNFFSIASIGEHVDKSVAYNLGYKDSGASFNLHIDSDADNLGYLGLDGVRVDNIFVSGELKSMEDDIFEGIEIKKNIVFYDREKLYNLEAILDKMNISGKNRNDVKVHLPEGLVENLPEIEGIEFKEYNSLNFRLKWDGIDDNKIAPTIDWYNDLISININHKNIDYSLRDILPSNDYERSREYVKPPEPTSLEDIEIKVPSYLRGEKGSKIPIRILGVVEGKNEGEELDHDVVIDGDYKIIKLNEPLMNGSIVVELSLDYLKDADLDDKYSLDFKVRGNMKNEYLAKSKTIEEELVKDDLTYIEPDLSYNTLNYHSIDMDSLVSLDRHYDFVEPIGLEDLLWGVDDSFYKDIKVFEDNDFFGERDTNGYVYFSYDLAEALNEFYGEELPSVEGLESRGISFLERDDSGQVDLDSTGYEKIDSDDIKINPKKDGKDLKHIVFGDENIFKNAREYFKNNKSDMANFKVFDFDKDRILIRDYLDEFSILTPHMLLVYEDVEEPGEPVEPGEPEEPEEPGEPEKPGEPGNPEIPTKPSLNKKDHIKYLQGYEDGTVRPEEDISREEVSAIFFRLLDKEYRETIRSNTNSYPDIDKARWSNKHISTLTKGNILEGYTDGNFKASKSMTRAEVAAVASRFDKLEELDESKFTDVKGHWAEKYIDSAEKKGWIEGYEDGSFKPDEPIKRGEFVTLVNKVLERKVNKENILKGIEEYSDLEADKWYYEAIVEAANSHEYKKKRLEDKSEVWLEITYPEVEM